MTTDELIKALREWGEAFANKVDKLHFLLMQAADRLEELDERVAIMMEGNKIESE